MAEGKQKSLFYTTNTAKYTAHCNNHHNRTAPAASVLRPSAAQCVSTVQQAIVASRDGTLQKI